MRAYAFCIILGVFIAVWLGNRRWVARGGEQGVIADVTLWAVPFGLAGGRLYHVITSPDAYFGDHGEPIRALYVWEGGLGIWGAIALGGVGAWIGCRRHRIPFPAYADAVAPGIALAQAIDRWGNWFNQELYGRPTTLPWGLEIDRAHRPSTMLDTATYHPTYLYESGLLGTAPRPCAAGVGSGSGSGSGNGGRQSATIRAKRAGRACAGRECGAGIDGDGKPGHEQPRVVPEGRCLTLTRRDAAWSVAWKST